MSQQLKHVVFFYPTWHCWVRLLKTPLLPSPHCSRTSGLSILYQDKANPWPGLQRTPSLEFSLHFKFPMSISMQPNQVIVICRIQAQFTTILFPILTNFLLASNTHVRRFMYPQYNVCSFVMLQHPPYLMM